MCVWVCPKEEERELELRFETLMRARQEGMNNKVQVEEDEDVVVVHRNWRRERGTNVFVMKFVWDREEKF